MATSDNTTLEERLCQAGCVAEQITYISREISSYVEGEHSNEITVLLGAVETLSETLQQNLGQMSLTAGNMEAQA